MNRFMMIATSAAVSIFGTALSAQAATEPIERTVSVQGQGKIEATPDIARLFVSASADGKESEATAATVRQTIRQLIDTVKGQGIVEKDIQTQYYSIQPRWATSNTGKSTRVGFTVSNSVQVTVHDLSKLGKLLSAVSNAGATTVTGPNFDFENPQALERKALALAVQDAKAKAAILAETAGATLGPVITLTQEPVGNGYIARPMMMARAAVAIPSGEEPVQTGEQTFTSNVTAVFGLK